MSDEVNAITVPLKNLTFFTSYDRLSEPQSTRLSAHSISSPSMVAIYLHLKSNL